ncbi:hypothetical protein Y1Q_0015340 [Alligator mississippiensis]|uniref:Uncharacterized protein n=1 Tax=Alligator mississippiensis TaxID=8496 RepID=A0A151N275_ALLMI|nr:hypothetical protein Y1Q_0015340 [Alligator mississippiensis]
MCPALERCTQAVVVDGARCFAAALASLLASLAPEVPPMSAAPIDPIVEGPCPGHSYSNDTHLCCMNDKQHWVLPRTHAMQDCCGLQPYDARTHDCSEDVTVVLLPVGQRWEPPPWPPSGLCFQKALLFLRALLSLLE